MKQGQLRIIGYSLFALSLILVVAAVSTQKHRTPALSNILAVLALSAAILGYAFSIHELQSIALERRSVAEYTPFIFLIISLFLLSNALGSSHLDAISDYEILRYRPDFANLNTRAQFLMRRS
mmetsp:Transcript_15673/g.40216  ORF Transcript_15673/g.40216 Transcript_15673/m.40216 type:complete len:123 (+) Transcript_15673:78-446(+)